MSDINTLFVVVATRGAEIVRDVVEGLRFTTAGRPHSVVCVCSDAAAYKDKVPDSRVLAIPETAMKFAGGAAMHWAIDKGHVFTQCVVVPDTTVICAQGADLWLASVLNQGAALVGVKSRNRYDDAYGRLSSLMDEWRLPHHVLGEARRDSLCDGFLGMTHTTVADMFAAGACIPDDCQRWDLPYSVFVSWVVQMQNKYILAWGTQERQMPPLYVGVGHSQPSPRVLQPEFAVYGPATGVMGETEHEVRNTYKYGLRSRDRSKVVSWRPEVLGVTVGEAAQ